ncbi:palmitoyltransferase hip14 [Anaeramoeba flamelloides]|uniref:Palmitoyltransferase n=1 Tax=Anaeramoeba flamelloides TaxID=1746091 RepID=A0AAV8ABP9_9EUKA|nr:palmitoyltransferase hip14 [Anaeramoeba flamelloides]
MFTENDHLLIYQTENNNLDKVKDLIENKNANVDVADQDGFTPAHLGCSSRIDESLLVYLLKQDPNLDVHTTTTGVTPLIIASALGNLSKVRLLLDNGADIGLGDISSQSSCLHYTAQENRVLSLHYLLNCTEGKKSFNINFPNISGQAPLHWACASNSIKTCEYLVRNRADINLQDNDGKTPSHLAAANNSFEALQLLILSGCDLSIVDNDGKSIFQCAQEHKSKDCVEYMQMILSKHGDSGLYPFSEKNRKVHEFERAYTLGFYFYPTAVSLLFAGLFHMFNFYFALFLVAVVSWLIYNFIQWPVILMKKLRSTGPFGMTSCVAVGSSLVFLLKVFPGLWIKKGINFKVMLILMLLTDFYMLYQLFLSYYRDPGYLNLPSIDADQFLQEVKSGMTPDQFCSTCQFRKPLRAKHDKYSNKCVACFDHFCPWTGSTIGDNNGINLFLFVVFAILATLIFIYCTHLLYQPDSFLQLIPTIYEKSKVYFVFFVESLFFLYFETKILFERIKRISSNLTPNEQYNYLRYPYLTDQNGLLSNPFDLGFKKNWMQYFKIDYHINWYTITSLQQADENSLNIVQNQDIDIIDI